MYNSTDSVEVVQPNEHLPTDFLTDIHGHSLIIVPFEDVQQVATQNFEHHAEMVAIVGLMDERIEQTHYMGIVAIFALPTGISVVLLDLLKNFHFIEGCLHIVWTALLNLDGNVCVVMEVFTKPHSREVSPTEFLYDYVTV